MCCSCSETNYYFFNVIILHSWSAIQNARPAVHSYFFVGVEHLWYWLHWVEAAPCCSWLSLHCLFYLVVCLMHSLTCSSIIKPIATQVFSVYANITTVCSTITPVITAFSVVTCELLISCFFFLFPFRRGTLKRARTWLKRQICCNKQPTTIPSAALPRRWNLTWATSATGWRIVEKLWKERRNVITCSIR